MMRLLLPILLLLLGVGGGIGAGMMLGGSSEPVAEEEGHGEEEDHAGDDGHGDEEHGEEEHSESTIVPRVEPATDTTEYVRMNNQFVVPVIRDGMVGSLVVMGLTIEVDTGTSGQVFNHEPRLRDGFLRVLFAHANAGGFDGSFTQSSALAPLREGLVESAEGVLGRDVVHDVLITDIARQDA